MTTWRTRVADFFALDSTWVREPSPNAQRRDATVALVLFVLSAVSLEMLRSGGALRTDARRVGGVPRPRRDGRPHRVPATLAARRGRRLVAGVLRRGHPDARHRHAALGAGPLLLRPLQRHGVGPRPSSRPPRHGRGAPADVRLAGVPVPARQCGRRDQRGPRRPEPVPWPRQPGGRRRDLHVPRQRRLLRRRRSRRPGGLERRPPPRPPRHAGRDAADPGCRAQGARGRRGAPPDRPGAPRRGGAPRLGDGRPGGRRAPGARRRPARPPRRRSPRSSRPPATR